LEGFAQRGDDPSDKRTQKRRRSRIRNRGPFSILTRRIIAINLVGLIVLFVGVLVLNQYRSGLIEERLQSLAIQGEITAGALAESAVLAPEETTSTPRFNLSAAAPVIRRVVLATGARLRLYDHDGDLVLDSRALVAANQVRSYRLPPPGYVLKDWPLAGDVYDWFVGLLPRSNLPRFDESQLESGWNYEEVAIALVGDPSSAIRVTDKNEMVLSVSVPVQRLKVVQGALMLTTEGGDIDALVRAERLAILEIFIVALFVSLLLSLAFARAIAHPIRQLAVASENIQYRDEGRVEIPDFSTRHDEIGDLSAAIGDMTNALYDRIDAIESFAADVAHEIKNPLTSLRSAVETLQNTHEQEKQDRLLNVIFDDVIRIDRLISDISDASRLDAELSRAQSDNVNVAAMLRTLVGMYKGAHETSSATIELEIDSGALANDAISVRGLEQRLAQVMRNLFDNALSFSESNDTVRVKMRLSGRDIVITVEDSGPGIPEENLETIFERFYTQRPRAEDFGKNSGLGLAISRQIVEAHRGAIVAENIKGSDGRVLGARFTVRLPGQ
jgi:two-component system sensor histidine kinase ChvG